jgi:hypothetical protein
MQASPTAPPIHPAPAGADKRETLGRHQEGARCGQELMTGDREHMILCSTVIT